MYAITLVTCLFYISYVIIVHFNLEMKQFDVMNAFVNAIRNLKGLLVLCKLLLRFEKLKYMVEVNCALYRLQDSLALWYND
jgi:hypothetical protein